MRRRREAIVTVRPLRRPRRRGRPCEQRAHSLARSAHSDSEATRKRRGRGSGETRKRLGIDSEATRKRLGESTWKRLRVGSPVQRQRFRVSDTRGRVTRGSPNRRCRSTPHCLLRRSTPHGAGSGGRMRAAKPSWRGAGAAAPLAFGWCGGACPPSVTCPPPRGGVSGTARPGPCGEEVCWGGEPRGEVCMRATGRVSAGWAGGLRGCERRAVGPRAVTWT